MRDIVPDQILDRSDKIGFDVPEDNWMRNKNMLTLFEKYLINNTPQSSYYISQSKTKNMFYKHKTRKANYGKTLFKVLILEIWLQRFFPEER